MLPISSSPWVSYKLSVCPERLILPLFELLESLVFVTAAITKSIAIGKLPHYALCCLILEFIFPPCFQSYITNDAANSVIA